MVDYVALGDTHSTESLSYTNAVWFSGAPETTDFHVVDGDKGERDSGNVLVVTITKAGDRGAAGEPGDREVPRAQVTVDKRRVGTWTFDTLFFPLTGEDDVRHFLDTLEGYRDKKRVVIKYGLEGTISLAAHRLLEDGLARYGELFAAMLERDRTMDLVTEPGPEELAAVGVQGYAAQALEELVAEMPHDPVARDAVNLLFRLSAKGA